ncbi:MAG TPA: hypothetical protein VMJ10_21275 [Kofleriaceae bacterium]|nr:hypothetical protein [Kofleriaceae bacterium]
MLAVALLATAACRGKAHHDDVGSAAIGSGSGSSAAPSPSSASGIVPRLPPSIDAFDKMQAIDKRLPRLRSDDRQVGLFLATLLERASIRGDLEDYLEALDRSKAWSDKAPKEPEAWHWRVVALSRVHRFDDARAALAKLKRLVKDASEWQGLEATIDEATGHLERSQPVRDAAVAMEASTSNLVQQAGGLAAAGKLDDALAIMPKAAAVVNSPSPELFNYLLFQWGRIYELQGNMAAAREFFAEARRRLPTLESTTHLAQTMIATGDTAGAKQLVEAELGSHRHPALLGLAVQLGHGELADEARAAWERYVTALPLAFADHAARFYVGPGKDPARALVLAKLNLANRDTHEARALVVEAALAAGDPKAACDAAAPLAAAGNPRADRFAAWKALSACGRHDEADRLAKDLGITH